MAKHHDTGYKELFSHPEFVQQLIEGFAPADETFAQQRLPMWKTLGWYRRFA